MDLIIVESPAKAKTIARYLGRGYRVQASVGHVRDLPHKTLGVDVAETFAPAYETLPDKKKILKALRESAKTCKTIYLATDPDREGEIIAYHLAETLRRVNRNIQRVTFSEITAKVVTASIQQPRALNQALVAAQQARRVMDRLVGYKISPFLWQAFRNEPGLSAGRVQSAALRLVCEREQAIQDFNPEPYWLLTGRFETSSGSQFSARLYALGGKRIGSPNEAQTQEVIRDAESAQHLAEQAIAQAYQIQSVKQQTKNRNPHPPFTTSTLQQAASTRLKFNPKRTMRTAQSLYEGVELANGERVGLITYMRTDDTRISQEAIAALRDVIVRDFGVDYVPAKPHRHAKKKAKNAQEAHEAIRPTHMEYAPKQIRRHLTADQFQLYQLIWQRTLASQMAPARVQTTTVDVLSQNKIFHFRATGSTVLFRGFLQAYDDHLEEKQKDLAQDEAQILPKDLQAKTPVTPLAMTPKAHTTKPPPRYTEASLVKALEAQGIGRPSTYSATVQTLIQREYAVLKKRKFEATERGLRVCQLLVTHFPNLFDLNFTAQMETQLDQIAAGQREYQRTLHDFYHNDLLKALNQAQPKQNIQSSSKTTLLSPQKSTNPNRQTCPECNRRLIEKQGPFGLFYACTGFPECRYTQAQQTAPIKAKKEATTPAPTCPTCESPMQLRQSKRGSFYGCTQYPTCRQTLPYLEPDEQAVSCPKCARGTLIARQTKTDRTFYGCSTYPACDYALWDRPVKQGCPACQHAFIVEHTPRNGTPRLQCPQCKRVLQSAR